MSKIKITAIQSSLITYVEDADLKQQRLSQANYLAELETFISGEIATIASYQHTIILYIKLIKFFLLGFTRDMVR